MTLQAALKSGEQYLKDRNIEDAGTDAWLLLQFVTGLDRTLFLLDRAGEMDEEQAEKYQELLRLRGRHIPLQHLTGEQEFMGLTFRVNEDVLIPRQDTEILVEEALKRLTPGMRVLDMCTGSGCIAISLAKLRRPGAPGRLSKDGSGTAEPTGRLPKHDSGAPEPTGRLLKDGSGAPEAYCGAGSGAVPVDGADISRRALAVAAENVKLLQANVRLLHSDLFSGICDVYDMIVSNPPYIPSGVIEGLSEEVRLHEPRTALDGREDGLYFYREIIKESRKHLAEGGWILFEIGYDQGKQVSCLLEEAGYAGVMVLKDLAGLDRVVLGRRER